jgi:hypothetical protein
MMMSSDAPSSRATRVIGCIAPRDNAIEGAGWFIGDEKSGRPLSVMASITR